MWYAYHAMVMSPASSRSAMTGEETCTKLKLAFKAKGYFVLYSYKATSVSLVTNFSCVACICTCDLFNPKGLCAHVNCDRKLISTNSKISFLSREAVSLGSATPPNMCTCTGMQESRKNESLLEM